MRLRGLPSARFNSGFATTCIPSTHPQHSVAPLQATTYLRWHHTLANVPNIGNGGVFLYGVVWLQLHTLGHHLFPLLQAPTYLQNRVSAVLR